MPGLVEKSPLKGTPTVGFTRLFHVARALMPGRGRGERYRIETRNEFRGRRTSVVRQTDRLLWSTGEGLPLPRGTKGPLVATHYTSTPCPTGRNACPTGFALQPTGRMSLPTGFVLQPVGQALQPTGPTYLPMGFLSQPLELALQLPYFVQQPAGLAFQRTGRDWDRRGNSSRSRISATISAGVPEASTATASSGSSNVTSWLGRRSRFA